MSVEVGYLGIMRTIKDNEYYKEPLTMRLYEHLLIDANFKDGYFRGQLIKRGQTAKSIDNLSLETGLTIKQVRTALDKLIKGKYIAKKGTNKYTLLTLLEYDTITFNPTYEGEQKANKGQTKGKQRATIEESNNNNNEINKEIVRVNSSLSHFDFLNLNFKNESLQLISEYKPKIIDWNFCIEKFNNHPYKNVSITTFKAWLKREFEHQNKNDIKTTEVKRILFNPK